MLSRKRKNNKNGKQSRFCVSEIASDEMSSSNHKLSHNGDYLLLLDLCYSLLLLDNHSPIESTG